MMKLDLGPDYEALIGELMASGNYSTEAEVLRDALRRLAEDRRRYAERLTALHAEIDAAEASGPAEPFDVDVFLDEMRAQHPE